MARPYIFGQTTPQRRAGKRAIATAFVEAVNAVTACALCSIRPIEWHHVDHVARPNDRVSSLRTQGASVERIRAEMDKSVPLCRTCHMTVHGDRIRQNLTGGRVKGVILTQPSPCSCCAKPTKPLRNGMCSGCDNHWSGRRVRKTRICDGCCT